MMRGGVGGAVGGGDGKKEGDGEGVVTAAMVAEEERLQAAAKEEQQQLQQQAKEEYESLVEHQRYMRLSHLLERSSLYTQFLYQRMQSQKEAEQKRQGKKKGKKQVQATDQSKGSSPKATTRTKATSAQSRAHHKTKRDGSYRLADYVDEKDVQSKAAEHASQTEDEPVQPTNQTKNVHNFEQPTLVTGGQLRDYQLAGVDWLRALYENGLNGILADEMGLGKTVQSIALFAHLYGHKVSGPYLVVAPLSTLPNWIKEFHRWTPDIPVILYHGTPEERAAKRPGIMSKKNTLKGFSTVVTSYEMVMRDRKYLQQIPWKYIVVDEGHRLKNLNCRLIRELKTYQSANRLLLTGTPLQNNLSELWSLLNFLLPDIFDDLDAFQRWFDFSDVYSKDADARILAKEQENHIISKLHQILQPFLLRRLKTDVELSIPPKKEMILYAPLTKLQSEYYKALLDKCDLKALLEGRESPAATARSSTSSSPAPSEFGGSSPEKPRRKAAKRTTSYKELSDTKYFKQLEEEVERERQQRASKPPSKSAPAQAVAEINVSMQNILMQLRKCCNHPYLLKYPLTPQVCTACVLCVCVCVCVRQAHPLMHTSLLFACPAQDYCWLRSFSACRLDGSVSFEDRKEEIRRFHEDDECFVFLLSTRAGGLGLNLVGADTCIIYDSDWNPQVDLQAQDRCHRIGQSKTVLVFRLITANTVDQRILERAAGKRKLERLVIHKSRFKGRGKEEQPLSKKDLLELLTPEGSTVQFQSDQILTDEELETVLDRDVDAAPAPATSAAFKVINTSSPATMAVSHDSDDDDDA
ncbi:hypothetical protein PTSG_07121 [Salpingoeca rosetta]|uniref:Uncharacterized protein n=1 Tax=Salpingoeca rosetta (strain ATCC 50818 / BSB-021) TaxID=946362 RepID=F2UE43_SALR5|nr:uncharacterized protein PTSG_07121 [Salpingoeca rosetta]EGD74893.1 hypothetical protein PTSG_07121 [Salpingoeca rosetta]|eukprot:XP_004992538.1 hypothetical protein PTSG_07121 [Salpingoeca rosetta]